MLRGKVLKFLRDDEIIYMGVMGVFSITVAFFSVCGYCALMNNTPFFASASSNLRDSAFYVVGSFTTSGFSNTSLERFRAMGRPLLFICTFLMVLGGGAGSAAGGIKMYRIVIMLKDLAHSIRHRFDPSRQMHPRLIYRYGKMQDLDEPMVREAHRYAILFIAIYGTLVLVSTCLPFYNGENGVEYAAFDVASAMSNTGLAMNDFSAYRAQYPEASYVLLWLLSIGEILGRLEVLPFVNSIRCGYEEVTYSIHRRRIENRNKANQK